MISKIKLITIGKVKEKYLLEGIKEYKKRLTPFVKLDIIELKENSNPNLDKYMGNNSYLLDANGAQYTSEEFSGLLKRVEGEITFIIGGAEGFSIDLKKKFKLISLSKMTFIHEMSQLIFLEQIYRGFMILNNRNYHK